MAYRREKYSLIYREKSHIFSLRLRVILLFFIKGKFFGQYKNSAVLPTMEEGYLHKTKLAYAYTSLGGVNAFIC